MDDPDWTMPGAETASPEPWFSAEIEDGFAWVEPVTTGEFIPQMFNYHNIGAIDFDKGCYLGQEIVARMQYRGALNRKLFHGESEAPHAVGDTLQDDAGKNIGTVVAAQGNVFLAVIQSRDDTTPKIPATSLVSRP